jgi:hypothetical protein
MLALMRIKRYVIVSAAVLAACAGAGGAVAASGGDDAKKSEQSVLDAAAKQLNVTPDALRSALGTAEDAQLDQAVKDGKITQAEADQRKAARAKDGQVLGGPGGGPGGRGHGGPGGPGHGGPGGPGGPATLDGAASALGLTADALRTKLDAGQSIADVAKAQNKDIADVKAAIKAAITKQLDADVTAGRITADQRTKQLAGLDAHLDDLVNDTPPKRGDKPPAPPAGASAYRSHRP